ncbi:MAG: rhodanese-like domain-containing protein, partial [Candidatus Kapaibacterium sp.]
AGYLADHLHELPRDRDIAVMCAAGARSTIACSVLARAGFTNLYNVSGGFDAWNAAGYEKVTGA